jgi:hypothetical protein
MEHMQIIHAVFGDPMISLQDGKLCASSPCELANKVRSPFSLEINHHDVAAGDAVAYLLLESCAQGGFLQLPILDGIQRPFFKRNMINIGAPNPAAGVLVPIDQTPVTHVLPPICLSWQAVKHLV